MIRFIATAKRSVSIRRMIRENGQDSNVSRNVARSNKESGLEASTSDVGYSNNVFGNHSGADVQSGTDLGGNMCGGTPGC